MAHTIDDLFPQSMGVKWWQIAQVGADAVEVRVLMAEPIAAADRERITSTLRETWNWNCRVDYRQLEGIPYRPGAKQTDFVNECGS